MKKLILFSLIILILLGEAMAIPSAAPAYTGAGRGVHARLLWVDNVATDAGSALNGFGQIAIQTIAAAESSDDDQCWTGIPCNNTTTTRLSLTSTAGTPSFLAQPDVPRTIILTPSGSIDGVVKITGTNIASASQTENYTLNSGSVVAGTKAFKTVTKIEGYFTSSTARTLKVGTGDLLGLNEKLATNTVLFCALGNTREGTAPTVTVSSTELGLNTIDTNTAPGGAVTKVWMVV
jgi:hypothetical protein